MRITTKILLAFLVFIPLSGYSQEDTKEIDSLIAILNSDIPDSIKGPINIEVFDLLHIDDIKRSHHFLHDAYTIANRINDTALLFECYIAYSDFYSIMNDYDLALPYIYKALDITSSKKNRATCHNRLSELFYFTDNMDKSISHARIALQIDLEINDTAQFIIDYHNIGTWHLELNNFDSALHYLYIARKYHSYIDDTESPLILCHLGQTYSYSNVFDSALHYQFEALRLDSLFESEYDVAIDENYISNTYLRKKEYNNALKYAYKSYERSQKLGLIDLLLYNSELLSDAYEQKGDFEKALKYSKLQNEYADSIREINSETALLGYEAKYNFKQQEELIEAKNAENNLLRKQKSLLILLIFFGILLLISTLLIIRQVTQRHKARKKLLYEIEKANASKEQLISVISHDLRSSIGTLRNSMKLINDEQLDPDTQNELISGYYPIVDSTYDLLENLLTWSQYNKDDLRPNIDEVDIKSIIDKAIVHVHHLAETKNILIQNNTDNITCVADKQMLSIVARNLLSNAIKFSHKNTSVLIQSRFEDNMCKISIEDQGIGIKPEILKNIFVRSTEFHTKGTLGERGSGLGLSLCKSFIEIQGGQIWVESIVNNGSTFTFSIPAWK